jgi:hypothetical protein
MIGVQVVAVSGVLESLGWGQGPAEQTTTERERGMGHYHTHYDCPAYCSGLRLILLGTSMPAELSPRAGDEPNGLDSPRKEKNGKKKKKKGSNESQAVRPATPPPKRWR